MSAPTVNRSLVHLLDLSAERPFARLCRPPGARWGVGSMVEAYINCPKCLAMVAAGALDEPGKMRRGRFEIWRGAVGS